jgi:hypothetical protein
MLPEVCANVSLLGGRRLGEKGDHGLEERLCKALEELLVEAEVSVVDVVVEPEMEESEFFNL